MTNNTCFNQYVKNKKPLRLAKALLCRHSICVYHKKPFWLHILPVFLSLPNLFLLRNKLDITNPKISGYRHFFKRFCCRFQIFDKHNFLLPFQKQKTECIQIWHSHIYVSLDFIGMFYLIFTVLIFRSMTRKRSLLRQGPFLSNKDNLL